MTSWVSLVSKAALVLFLISTLVTFWLTTKILDHRRGRQLSALRVMLNPMILDAAALTDEGRRYHRRLVQVWSVGLVSGSSPCSG
ncbi:hypothetical protein [Phenylobacterium sp. SCN 70-31]|uniref:hypothetical protein n=1 Tax=Phenylobacterium sp. SCN 70-31 TaxID=1660129 RepID=UPI0025E68BD0|nr:hypothetical protein [Phenylobacterium sp. SCN 70-31]